MKANANVSIDFEINNHIIQSEPVVKLLGIHIDSKLNFDSHVSIISRKAAKQINVLQKMQTH